MILKASVITVAIVLAPAWLRAQALDTTLSVGDTVRLSVRPNTPYVGARLPLRSVGVFLGMVGDTVRFQPAGSGPAPASFLRTYVDRIEVRGQRGRSSAVHGLVIGAFVGLALGVIIAQVDELVDDLTFGPCSTCPGSSRNTAATIAVPTVLFGGVGLYVGSTIKRPRWHPVTLEP